VVQSVEEVGAEFAVGRVVPQYMIGDGEKAVCDGDQSAFGTTAGSDPSELGAEVGILGSRSGPCTLDQGGLQVLATLPCGSALVLAALSLLPGQIPLQEANAVTDRDQLGPMAWRAKEVLQVEKLQVVADMGYYFGREVKTCVEAGITPYVPQPDTSANTKLGLFAKKDFR
jgi:hypothetical protein